MIAFKAENHRDVFQDFYDGIEINRLESHLLAEVSPVVSLNAWMQCIIGHFQWLCHPLVLEIGLIQLLDEKKYIW